MLSRASDLTSKGYLAALIVAMVLSAYLGLDLLHKKWISLDPAVFEADVYAQGVAYALKRGSYWPWDLTPEFWPFLTIAPGLYFFIPILALFPGGFSTLVIQGLSLTFTAYLLFRLSQKKRPDAPLAALFLSVAWLVHPITGVGMAWGWCFYTFGAPLTVLAFELLEDKRWVWGGIIIAVAAAMKVNVALSLGGLALWALLRSSRAWALPLLLGIGAWIAISGTMFMSALLSKGRLALDLNLNESAAPTLSGLLTVALITVPLLPLIRHVPLLVLCAAGLELLYTTFINPANSGLVGATAILFIGACQGLQSSKVPVRAALATLVLSFFAHQAFRPPVVSPLPFTGSGLNYEVVAEGEIIRQWTTSVPDGASLVVSERLAGSVGLHKGPLHRLQNWDSSLRPTWVLHNEANGPDELEKCLLPILKKHPKFGTVWAGYCP